MGGTPVGGVGAIAAGTVAAGCAGGVAGTAGVAGARWAAEDDEACSARSEIVNDKSNERKSRVLRIRSRGRV